MICGLCNFYTLPHFTPISHHLNHRFYEINDERFLIFSKLYFWRVNDVSETFHTLFYPRGMRYRQCSHWNKTMHRKEAAADYSAVAIVAISWTVCKRILHSYFPVDHVDDFYLHRSFSFSLNRQALENTKELKVRLFKIINKKMRGIYVQVRNQARKKENGECLGEKSVKKIYKVRNHEQLHFLYISWITSRRTYIN